VRNCIASTWNGCVCSSCPDLQFSTMQPSLPDLPFPTIGIDLFMPRSSANTGPRAYPRTDLAKLQPWTSFTSDIEDVIHTKMTECNIPHGTQLTVGCRKVQPPEIDCEEGLRSHADGELHEAVRGVLGALGIPGCFKLPSSGNIAIVGEPDFSWITRDTSPHPKLVVCIPAPLRTQKC
jgi:hypothetical protein